MSDPIKKIEKLLEENVRPILAKHEGDIELVSFEDGILTVRFIGQCSGCPSAYITAEEIVKKEVTAHFPQVKDVVLDTGVSEEMLDFAKKLMSRANEADALYGRREI